jgi:DNA polymerase-1
MNYLLQMSKNRCSFNELEFRRMAEQFDSIFKRRNHKTSNPSDDNSSKSPNKSEDQFDLLEFQMNLQKKTTINITKHYRTLNILIRLFKVI